MFTPVTRVVCLVCLLFACAACDLEVIPDNFSGGPNNGLPQACFTIDRSTCELGDCNLVFDAGCSTNAASYEWDFDEDDNADREGVSVNHNFTNVGTFAVKLLVEDDEGRTNETTMEVMVNAAPIKTFEATVASRGEATGLYAQTNGDLLMTGSTSGVVYIYRVNCDGDVTLNRTYPNSGADLATDIRELSDGSIVVTGSAFNNVRNLSEIFYLRVAPDGSPLHGPLSISRPGASIRARRILELVNGSIAFVGTTRDDGSDEADLYLRGFTPNLSLQNFETEVASLRNDFVFDALALTDDIVVVGQSTGAGDPQGFFARFDLQGILRPGQPRAYVTEDVPGVFCAAETEDGGLRLGAVQSPDNTTASIALVETSLDGGIRTGFPLSYATATNDYGLSCKITPAGETIIAGQRENDALLLGLDNAGAIAWERNSGIAAIDGYNRIVTTPDGGLAVCGFRGTSLYYAKTNAVGEID